ncbi:hypothetical protein AX17_006431 [Amanita inopinata Kibby_2008]|nr:hypothetical protein AX17_006431 [Amanita inopinata Kibby_2008]
MQVKYARQVFAPTRKNAPLPLDVGEKKGQAQAWHLDINTKELRWDSYVKAGYYGVLDHFFSPGNASSVDDLPVAVDLLVAGTVPAGSGLSSSAAMVVASSLAFLAVNGKLDHPAEGIEGASHRLTKGELVKMAMENEKRVGVNSGGMDQAASVMSDPSSALYISFYPTLTASPVPLPPKAVFICANSLVISDKAVTAKSRYNLRVVETLVGARVLAKELQIDVGEKERITFREVAGRFASEKGGEELGVERLEEVLEEMSTRIDVLKPHGRRVGGESEDAQYGMTMEEMIEMSGLSRDAFYDVYLSWVEVEATHFQLYKRAKHVLSESLRVLQFRKLCLSSSSPTQDTLHALGNLMNASQSSCASFFDCSCPELDTLTRLALQSGAYGSRLTGAGWGGCTVSLVPEGKVESFIAGMIKSYQPYRELELEVGRGGLEEVIFATRPSKGACVYKFT